MIERTFAAVVAALLTFWIAFAIGADVPPANGRVVTKVPVSSAELPIACPGSLDIPAGNVGGGTGLIGSGSDDIRESIFPSGVDTAIATGEGWTSTSALATEIERVGGGDIAGLAAVACLPPRNETWLVGGSTVIGSSARLVLTNPTDVASNVTVEFYGPSGKVDQSLALAVGPHSQTPYLLEGVVSGLPTLVVHVTATAAGVSAVLQDSRLDGFRPAGTDWVVPNEAFAETLVIPGVGPSEPDGSAGPSSIRLFSPRGATVTLSLAGTLGDVPWPAGKSVVLRPGNVVDVPVPATDVASVVVKASAPVYAAAWTTVGRPPSDALQGGEVHDGAWVNGQAHAADRSYSVVVPHYSVSAIAYAADAATFRVVGVDGTEYQTLTIPAGTTREFPLNVPSGTLVSVDGAIAWSVRVRDVPGFVTAIQPEDIGPVDAKVAVESGTYVP